MADPMEAREQLAQLAEQCGNVDSYINTIWKMRYPEDFPKSSDGWPFKKAKPIVAAPPAVIHPLNNISSFRKP